MLITLTPVFFRTFAFLLLISTCHVNGGKKPKLRKEDLEIIRLPPCAACKLLIESFNKVSYNLFIIFYLKNAIEIIGMTPSNQRPPRFGDVGVCCQH